MPHFSGKNVISESIILSGDNPIQITSTQKITNLNSNYLEGYNSSYFLDLGNMTGILPYTSFSDSSHGSRSGGTLHTTVSTSANGFMSYEDKVKLDGIQIGSGVNQNAYSFVSDGTNIAQANTTTDTIRFRTSDVGYLSITVSSNDPTFGDNILFSLNVSALTSTLLQSCAPRINYITKSTNYTIQKYDYIIPDTSLIPLTFTLPPSSTFGDFFYISDFTGGLSKNPVTLSSGIYNGTLDSFECSQDNVEYKFTYIGGSVGWGVHVR